MFHGRPATSPYPPLAKSLTGREGLCFYGALSADQHPILDALDRRLVGQFQESGRGKA